MTLKQTVSKSEFEKALNISHGNLSKACVLCGLTDTNPRYYINKMGWGIEFQYKLTKIKGFKSKRPKKRIEIDIDTLKADLKDNTDIESIIAIYKMSNFGSFKTALAARGYRLSKVFKLKTLKKEKRTG